MQLARTPVYYLTAVGECTLFGVVLYVLLTSEGTYILSFFFSWGCEVRWCCCVYF